MDFKQNKLTKNEWNNIEIPISNKEKIINKLIIDGYNNVNIVSNNTLSLMSYLKINYTKDIEIYIYYICFFSNHFILLKSSLISVNFGLVIDPAIRILL